MENISRGPYLRWVCNYPHRGADAGRHSCKTTEYKSTDFPFSSLLNAMYCVRVFLWTVKICIPCATLKRRGSRVIFVYLWVRSHAPSIRSYRGTKVVWPDFQPMRVPVEPVSIDLFRQNPVFTSLHLKSPVHVVQPLAKPYFTGQKSNFSWPLYIFSANYYESLRDVIFRLAVKNVEVN